MKIIDLHSDIFTDVALRREMGEQNVIERIHLPKLQKSSVAGIIGVFWVEPKYKNHKKKRFLEILKYVTEDLSESSKIKVITTPKDLVAAYQADDFFIYLGIEGLTFIEEWTGTSDVEKFTLAFDELNQQSIKHSIFAWNEKNFIATGSGNPENNHSGLSLLGKYVVEEHQKHEWIIDVSHLDETSFWDVLEISNQPILASHSNAKELCSHKRNLTDEQIKAIANTGGLIGVNAYGSFVDSKEPTLSKVADHISYIVNLVGIDYVGLGMDFVDYLQSYDLGDDLSNMTKGLEDVGKLPDLLTELLSRGFTTEDINKIAFWNFYRFLTKIHQLN
ncbi:dipeptidase [Sporosarcina siberiensis]|uniref:Dipeptidase n=1 Tax=Sporosarcina siberiensis TaxID=1365606 RepID=A0ABW4SEH9_9BACL